MKLTDFKMLTYDTCGTLIDWKSGIYKRGKGDRGITSPTAEGVGQRGRRYAEATWLSTQLNWEAYLRL